MSESKPGLSMYERRYIAVLAAVVLVFVIVGIAMSIYQPTPEPMPVTTEELFMPDIPEEVDTVRHRSVKAGKTVRDSNTSDHRHSRRKRSKSPKPPHHPVATPARDPVHSSPIPAD